MNNKSLHERLHDPESESISSGYRWPGNRLSYLDMKRLIYVSNKTKRPINQIIKEAVQSYTTVMIAKLDDSRPDSTPDVNDSV